MIIRPHQSALLAALLILALVGTLRSATISHAQAGFTIKITEPAEGANLSGPFIVAGTSTVPFENQLLLKVTSTSTSEQLIVQSIAVTGEAGQQGTFRVTLNYSVAAATPALIQVIYNSPKDGSMVAKSEVRVVLRKYDATPAASTGIDSGMLAAVQLALLDYEGRVQTTTPIPQSMEDQTFSDQCLGLARAGEACAQAEVTGKIVKLTFGGMAFTYRVGNNQARLDESQSGPISQRGTGLPKLLADASAATGVKLYLPPKFMGPFEGLFFKRVDWDSDAHLVTITYSGDSNPTDIIVEERSGSAAPAPAKPNGETVQIGGAALPVQVDAGRKYVEWLAQSTIIRVSVPQSINTADLAAFANGFALPGGQAGQANLLDRTQFGKLTLNLPEPSRSLEMARQALLGLVKPPRQGGIISVQARQFKDACLELMRAGEACTSGMTPGFVIGVADTELYRYHVANGQVRLNRDNSELRIKGNAEIASVEAARASVTFPLVAPTDPGLVQLGIETGKIATASGAQPGALLIYRDIKTGGVLALQEIGDGTPPGSTTQDQQITVSGKQVAVKSDANGRTASLLVQGTDKRQTLVTLWASPEIGVEEITRVFNSLTSG
jgi:hypothetical protein